MNVVIVPFHDWRKILIEGFRTRDAHFIEQFEKHNNLNIIVNRPTTRFEISLRRKQNLIKGEVVLARQGFKLYKISERLYLIDFVSNDIIGQVLKGYNWFIEQYANPKYIAFINDCFKQLGIADSYNLINQNIFAFKLSEKLNPRTSIFDAWDNFTKFEVYSKVKDQIESGYNSYATNCDFWITNSKDNIACFQERFNPKQLYLITNGVDVSRFSMNNNMSCPEDLKSIQRPIVGFGGKITHLIDVDLVNETVEKNKNISFVFVGQILDKSIFNAINKTSNFYYLGDKHYESYPNYVKNFDVCTVPYITDEEKKSGANTIKVYEYLATNKKVIGTGSNGLEDLKSHLYIVNNAIEFTEELKDISNHKEKIDLNSHSWKTKTQDILKLLEAHA